MQFRLTNDDMKLAFKNYVNGIWNTYNNIDKSFYVDFKTGSEIRSLEQNKYYWSVVIPISQMVIADIEGRLLEPELVHEQLKYEFGTLVFSEQKNYICLHGTKIISWDEFDLLDYSLKYKCTRLFNMPSTTKMTKTKFNEYLKLIQEWAAFLGFEIPDPC